MTKYINKDLIERVGKTFLQAFLGSLIVSINGMTSVSDTMIKSAIFSAVTAGVCAVMNFIINYLDREENKDDI